MGPAPDGCWIPQRRKPHRHLIRYYGAYSNVARARRARETAAATSGGSHSKRGAEVAAILHTLFESATLAGVDPHAYVLEATRRAIASPGAVTLPEDLT